MKEFSIIIFCFLFFTSFTFIILGYIAALRLISYLPDVPSDALSTSQSFIAQCELKNPSFTLMVDKKGRVSIKSIDGSSIMSSLTYMAMHDSLGSKTGLDKVEVNLINDSTIVIKGIGLSGVMVNILLKVCDNDSKLDVSVETIYKRNTIVLRESLIACFDVPASEVYLKNRQIDINSFNSEYWLQKQGVRFGKGIRSALIYHTPFISSLQLDSKKRILFINLDYNLDHPHVNIPYQETGGGEWKDLSSANYIKDFKRNNNFSIYFGSIPNIIPRLMLVPNGYRAGYVFTEHADETSLKTNRAVYFGSENITDIDSAAGGFVGNRIPVTKSVFFDDNSLGTSIRGDSQFLQFLDQLHATGLYEICLHTPDNLNSSRKLLEESIQFMKQRFNTISWIDHGMYSGKENRECFVCDGLNMKSEYFAGDLWEKYGTLYFWNTAKELIIRVKKGDATKFRLYNKFVKLWRTYLSPREMREMGFILSFTEVIKRRFYSRFESNSLNPVKGDSYPTPLYYQHPTYTKSFYSWITEDVKDYKELSLQRVKIEEKLINRLLNNWGIFINHGYFPRIGHGNDLLEDCNGEIMINQYFNKILDYMAQLRDKGDLYITTIRDLLNYWILTNSITFKYLPDGIIYVYNNNDKDINGLSMAVRASEVRVNGDIPKLKWVGDDIIFWFDIKSGDNVVLKVND